MGLLTTAWWVMVALWVGWCSACVCGGRVLLLAACCCGYSSGFNTRDERAPSRLFGGDAMACVGCLSEIRQGFGKCVEKACGH